MAACNTLLNAFYTPPNFSGGVYILSVCMSVRPSAPFPIYNLSRVIFHGFFFKLCIHIVIRDEWYGIVNGQNPSIFNRVLPLFILEK